MAVPIRNAPEPSPQTVAPPPAAPRLVALEALREPRYRRFWLASACLNTARWLDVLVVGWMVLELTGSPLLVGVAGFCRMAPMMTLGLFAGLLADRFDRGRMMLLSQVFNVGSALVMALLFATGHAGFLQLALVELVLGMSWVVDHTTRRTVVYTLVGRERLTNAFSLESVSMQGSKMIGPLLGGVLLANAGPVGCYLVLALLYTGALLFIASLRTRVSLAASGVVEPVLPSLLAGLREARANGTIRAVLLITMVMNALVFPYQQMLPVFAREVLNVGPELLGLLLAADGLGALTGALLVASRRGFTSHARVFAGGSLLAAVLVCCLALAPWYLLALALQLVIGVAEAGFATMQITLILLSASERVRGRMSGILSASIGTHPIGTLWIGFVAGQLGAPFAMATSAALALVLMLPLGRRMLAPASAEERR